MKLITILSALFLVGSIHAQDLIGESVEYDPVGNRFFVSSDANSIQIVDADTEETSHLGEGLEASFGMEVMNNHLFAIEGSGVKVYDLETEMLVKTINVTPGNFLNGMTSDGASRIWITDFSALSIQEINYNFETDEHTTTFIAVELPNTPNGIVYDGPNNRLLFVTWNGGKVNAIDLDNNEFSEVADVGLDNMDGIDEDANGSFYVSSWSPQRITKFNNDFTESETIEVSGLLNGADICYAKEIGTLAIPSTSNELILVKVEDVFGSGIENSPSAFQFWPNPVESVIHFDVKGMDGSLKISIHDLTGKWIRDLFTGNSSDLGNIEVENIPTGSYFLRLETEKRAYTQSFMKQ